MQRQCARFLSRPEAGVPFSSSVNATFVVWQLTWRSGKRDTLAIPGTCTLTTLRILSVASHFRLLDELALYLVVGHPGANCQYHLAGLQQCGIVDGGDPGPL